MTEKRRVVLMRWWWLQPWKQVKILAGNLDACRWAQERFGRPHRDDDVERWIKRMRDRHSPLSDGWHDLDWMLDDYRLHADTGTPLDAEVIEHP